MSSVKNVLEEIANCSNCYGLGSTGWVNSDGDYDLEFCECNPYCISQDEMYEYNQLFQYAEAN